MPSDPHTYVTKDGAKRAAMDLGLSEVRKMDDGMMTTFRPGGSESALQDALNDRQKNFMGSADFDAAADMDLLDDEDRDSNMFEF